MFPILYAMAVVNYLFGLYHLCEGNTLLGLLFGFACSVAVHAMLNMPRRRKQILTSEKSKGKP